MGLAVALATDVSAHPLEVLGYTPVLVFGGPIPLTPAGFPPSSRDERSQHQGDDQRNGGQRDSDHDGRRIHAGRLRRFAIAARSSASLLCT
jgi:hypothetical protein